MARSFLSALRIGRLARIAPFAATSAAIVLVGLLATASVERHTRIIAGQAPRVAIYLPVLLSGNFGPPPVANPTATLGPTTTASETVPVTESPTPGTPSPTLDPTPGTETPTTEPPPTTGTPTTTATPPATPVRRSRHGRITGSVYAEFAAGQRVALPDVTIMLTSIEDGTELARTTTDLYGTYNFPPRPAGTYGFCVEGIGFPGECRRNVTLADEDVVLQPFAIRPAPGVIHGRIALQDGAPCLFSDPARDVLLWTEVQLQGRDGTPLSAPVRANALGEYVLGGVPIAGGMRLAARCEAEERVVEAPTDIGDVPRRVDIDFLNASPIIAGFEVRMEGRGAQVVPPGAVVDVAVLSSDVNGDGVRHEWFTAPGSGEIVSTEGALARWRLPMAEGVFTLYAVASDGRGGYARGSANVEVRESRGARFAGSVIDAESGLPIEDAMVRVQSSRSAADSETSVGGTFDISATWAVADEALIYAHRKGFAPEVAMRDSEARGMAIRLAPLAGQTFDPASAASLVDRRPAIIRARRPGARVELPPDSLVAVEGGDPPAGEITAMMMGGPPDGELSRPLGFDGEGTPVHLDRYGVVSMAFYDGEGRVYVPKTDTRIGLTVPISATIAVSAPLQAPIWFLDGATGMWWDTGSRADLVETIEGPAYTGEVVVSDSPSSMVEHIYQVAYPDGFDLTCIRVATDATIRAGTTLRAEPLMLLWGENRLTQYEQPVVMNQSLYPFLQVPKANTLRLSLLDTKGQVISTATKVIALGTRPAIAGEGEPGVPAPYSACGAPVPMSISFPPEYATGGSESKFLTGFGFPDYTADGISYADVTAAYYQGVDPLNERTTLSQWWQKNGFGPKGDAPGGTGELRAKYLNHNDLGFGRDMHCLRNGQDVACWVTNYGTPDFGPDTGYTYPGNADLAATRSGPGATVTMEFTDVPAEPGRRFVTFYAYGGGTGSAPRIDAVDLDGSFAKPIPQVCSVCHGGRYDPQGPTTGPRDPLAPTVDDLDFGASFREFDLPSLRYTGGRDHTQLSATELLAYRDLNERVRDYTAPSAAISELLDGWYGPLGSPKPGPAPDLSFVPPGFVGPAQRSFYEEIIATSCRTCHIARGPSQDFNAYTGELNIRRGAIEYLVCGQGKLMPNARLTFNNFWWSTSPYVPARLAAWDDGAVWTPAIGVCK